MEYGEYADMFAVRILPVPSGKDGGLIRYVTVRVGFRVFVPGIPYPGPEPERFVREE